MKTLPENGGSLGAQVKTIGAQTIYLRKAAAKNLVGAGTPTGLVFQALRYVGKDGVNAGTLQKIAMHFTAGDLQRLVKDSQHAPDWMKPVARDIARLAPLAA